MSLCGKEDEINGPEEEEEEEYDQIKAEMEFYPDEDAPGDASTDVDSGYNTARSSRWHVEVPFTKENQIRASTKVIEVTIGDVRRMRRRMQEYDEERNRPYVSRKEIAQHLLDFITPKLEPDYKLPRVPCIFQVENGCVQVHSFYQNRRRYVDGVVPAFVGMAEGLKAVHNKWRILEDFAHFQRRPEEEKYEKPMFVTCWLEIYDEFVADYFREMNRLKNFCKTPCAAFHESRQLRSVVLLLASIVQPVRMASEWRFVELDLAWSLLLSAVSDAAVLPEKCKPIALRMQTAAFSVFLGFLDRLYLIGEVPDRQKADFVIYRDHTQPCQFGVHNLHPKSAIWTKELVTTIRRGAIVRYRLGPLYMPDDNSFSDQFGRLLPDWQTKITPLEDFRQTIVQTSTAMTGRLSEELFRQVISAGLMQLWKDIRNVTIGTAASFFAQATFNLTKSILPGKAFRQALLTGEVSNVGSWRRQIIPGHTGAVECEPPEILRHLISPAVISTMNQILDSWLLLYRMHFILVNVIEDKDILASSSTSMQRKFRFVVNKLYSVLTIIRNDFYRKINGIFATAEEKMTAVKSYYDAETVIRDAEKGLLRMVDTKKDPTTDKLWNVIHTFSDLIDDVRLKSVSNSIDGGIINNWRRNLLYHYEGIRSMGVGATPDNIFFSIYSQIQYR